MSFLLSPLQVKALSVSNRLVMPPMATAKADDDGKVTRDIVNYYAEKSLGGYIGLIIIEHSYIRLDGKAGSNQLSAADDSVIPSLRTLADTIHKNGSKAIIQLNHAGSAAKTEFTGLNPVGPSSVVNPRHGGAEPHELTHTEITDIVDAFAGAALRVKEAGFDGAEIHSAHGYLLNQFFSPLSNKRTDEYGGNVYNRIRIHLEVIKAVRTVVGENFPLLLRLGASDFAEGGTTTEDSQAAAREFEKAGIDILDVSGGFSGYNVPGLSGQGYFAPLTEAIKKVTSFPVILTGGITEVQSAEQLLADGKADLIGVGRAIYKDSKWAERAVKSFQ